MPLRLPCWVRKVDLSYDRQGRVRLVESTPAISWMRCAGGDSLKEALNLAKQAIRRCVDCKAAGKKRKVPLASPRLALKLLRAAVEERRRVGPVRRHTSEEAKQRVRSAAEEQRRHIMNGKALLAAKWAEVPAGCVPGF
eukprot:Sspe_Gene.99372::Locus_72901_Transcript_1_1_Confidence_1.000_Length_771::g.99372::m.99372